MTDKSPSAVPGHDPQPATEPVDEEVETVPLEDDEGHEHVIRQDNAGGYDNMAGGGEWPDPDTPPRGPAPGTARD